MIQKFFITAFIILVFLFGIRFIKKLTLNNQSNKTDKSKVVDLEKDPETNEYKPKE